MIRLINCIRKRADISTEEFRIFWNDPEFDRLMQLTSDTYGATRWARSLTLQVQANVRIREVRGSGEPFDGVVEYWWEHGRDLMDIMTSDAGAKVLDQMHEYQRQFVDFSGGSAFFTDA